LAHLFGLLYFLLTCIYNPCSCAFDFLNGFLQQLHPDGQYCIGQDSGIYWTLTQPPKKGAEAPDWFYVANVPPLLNGEYRRSYVLWKEKIVPYNSYRICVREWKH
jgi:hypothetical protein